MTDWTVGVESGVAVVQRAAITEHGLWLGTVLARYVGAVTAAETPKLQPVPLSAVRIHREFWRHRQKVNREKTIRHLLEMCRREGRVRTLLRAAGSLEALKRMILRRSFENSRQLG
ncbi:MAG: hypothetical protein ACQESR_09645 [Planctomycetota bacterium]